MWSGEEDSDINEPLQHLHQQSEDSDIDQSLQLPHQQPQAQPQPSPMASPKKVRLEPSLAIFCRLMRGLQWDPEYRHSRAKGDAVPQYVEICEDVNHHAEIETELQALGYERAWQRKRWRVWLHSGYVANFSLDLHQEDWPAEEARAPNPGKGRQNLRAATLGDFMVVTQRSKAKAPCPLHLKRSGRSSDVESAQRGVPSWPGPPPAAAARWTKSLLLLSAAKWLALVSASAACPATSRLPETGPGSRRLRWTQPS